MARPAQTRPVQRPPPAGIRGLGRRFGPQVYATDREFLEPARAIVESPASPIKLALAMAICAIFVVALIAAFFGRVDIYAVAPGRIEPTGRTKVIQPLEDGKVTAIHVEDGSRVAEGQLLVEMDPTLDAADRAAAAAQQGAFDGEIARRKVAIAAARSHRFDPPPIAFPADVPPATQFQERAVLAADLGRLQTQVGLLVSKISEDETRIRATAVTLSANRTVASTLTQRVAMRQGLQRDGWDSRSNVLDAAEELQKQAAEITTEQGDLAQTRAEMATARRQIDDTVAQFIADNATALDQAETKADANAQALVKATSKLEHMRLTSPIAGTVQQLEVTTLGQVVSTGQQLMTVVPNNAPLEIEALVLNQDIGFVHPGQTAVVKVDSFPFTRYGTLNGRVVRVSRDAVSSPQAMPQGDTETKPVSAQSSAAAPTPKTQDLVYTVRVLLDRDTMVVDGRTVHLSPGMTTSVEIRTGRRRVISYLLSPFVKTVSEAGHER